MNTTDVFGLGPAAWNAIASISQALAACGALALMYMTWRSGKDTKAAIENSYRLALATDQLVTESKRQQSLAVLPVIEVNLDRQEKRLRVINNGNGPLLGPMALLNGNPVEIRSKIENRHEYAQVATLSCNCEAIVNLDEVRKEMILNINGFILTGERFEAFVDFRDFENASRVVAVSSSLKPAG